MVGATVSDSGTRENAEACDKEEGEKGVTHKSVPYYKLFSFADTTDMVLMVVGSIAAIGSGLSMPSVTIIFGRVINSFGQTQDISKVVHAVSMVALDFVYLAIGSFVAALLQVSCWMIAGERQAARIRSLYLRTILRQDMVFFDMETSTGEVISRISGDTSLIQDAMSEKVGKFIQLVSTFIGGFAVAFFQGWLLALVMLSSFPPIAVCGAAMAVTISKMSTRGQAAYNEAGIVVEQTISSIKTVASFTGEKQAVAKYNKSLRKAYMSTVQEGSVAGAGFGALLFFFFGSYALALWFGCKLILEKGYTGGQIFNVIMAILTGGLSLGQASPCMAAFAAGQAAASKMLETIKRKPVIDAYDTSGTKLENVKGDIEFRDVHFCYPARPDVPIFAGFSLCIPSGRTVALVGESGSGKSTIISLIERFYDPDAGEVLVDGVNLKHLQLRWIREKIGLVSQEPVLFASSIRENIAYGKDGATTEEIMSAIELANASKFIENMPQGLDTMVGERGTQLSGGQKQRVAIARAILKNPRILLLDEATSALDAESERLVQEALDRIMVDCTTVVIAHRLATVKNSDTIVVLNRGLIIEKGSHSDLLKNQNGAYSQLLHLQELNQVKQEEQQYTEESYEKPDIISEASQPPSQRFSLSKRLSFRLSMTQRFSFQRSSSSSRSFTPLDFQETTLPKSATTFQECGDPQPNVSLARLAHLNKPEFPVLFLGAVAAGIHGLILPVFGLLLSSILRAFFEPPQNLKKEASSWSLMFLFLGVGSFVVSPVHRYFFAVAGGKLIRRVRAMAFEAVVRQEMGWFDEVGNTSAEVAARLEADAAGVRSLVGEALGLAVQNVATAVGGVVIAFSACWQLALLILALSPLVGLEGWTQMRSMKGFSADAKAKYEEASRVASDAVGSIRTVASFCAEEKVMDLFTKACEGPVKAGVKQGVISGISFGTSLFLLYCMYAVSFYVGAHLVEDSKTTFGKVFKVFFVLTMSAVGLSQSSSWAPEASKAKASAASIFAILDRKSKIDSSDDSGTTLPVVKGDIEFNHVSFKYPSRPNVQIFTDLCLTIESGKTVAIVGESGSGKSTIISLLERFYDPNSGCILLDHTNIQQLNLQWLRQQMGLVSQEPVLFNDTIRANIAYGKDGEASEVQLVAASEAANAHTFISSLPEGYDTRVGERGAQLSGGQKQRVAIARAILRDPRVLLLDEATSALDVEAEKVVQQALDRVMVGRTTIVVAHRLSTIKGADSIVVLRDGVVAEKGRHEELKGVQGGAYASLVALHVT
ncbi:ABC transporter B family member 11 [Amborella trichopoda]|uniref:MDR-like ABC transporter n=1 Tax=Amborella trichopoda TaxID=13333 RepID=W1P2Z2_AMBTC|nr:ABC transporter B family member 11 [Amborella trichopoda]ERN02024.1 hypothetical protein AMTR_s00045p00108620 [Amborella trichopoda]|eukprot:XP_006840349.3 ABC transporter B family member 11 [Amborella trichopoda]